MNKCYGLRYSLDNDQEWSVTTEGESGTSKESLYPEVPLEELSDFLLVLTSTCCALAAKQEAVNWKICFFQEVFEGGFWLFQIGVIQYIIQYHFLLHNRVQIFTAFAKTTLA